MDTQRLILFVIFSFSALFLWEAWQREHRPPAPTVSTAKPAPADSAVPTPSTPVPPPVPGAAAPAALPPPPADAPPAAATTIVVKTDLYTADIDSAGGVIAQVALNEHRDTGEAPYYALLRTADRTFVAQSGLLGTGM